MELYESKTLVFRIASQVNGRLSKMAGSVIFWGLLVVVLLGAVSFLVTEERPVRFPSDIGKDVSQWIDLRTDEVGRNGAPVFDGIREAISWVLVKLRNLFTWIPWPALIGLVGLLAWRMAGIGVALFALGGMFLIGWVELWESAMETLALMVTAVLISVAMAIPLGIAAARSTLLDNLLRPILDLMQTMPSFVYLVPAILFFSLGNVPAVIATVIYAVPPAIRFTNLGIRMVSTEVVEAARSFGSTPSQVLFKVQIPLALPTIMAGINQTIMLALAMVVVASLVGAGGLGEDVLRAIGRLEVGKSVIAGTSIVILAIIMDRISQAVGKGRRA